ncbi:hypothetical protein SAMN05421640_0498 [Ekhidna lutea]|uniref:Uncharacterized protein n=1 Tax=Ekhidna lutea TaxID=447679 RepID=A0A239F6C2_EKHLU|nr:hypothetical protein [Ekhidna lutea]SNS52028.1 hypothetical protein SAMN05421640_0498 [Ekhidna lutea]
MSNNKINLKHILIEAILIVFTVSLALALSEWRQQIKTENLVDRVLISLGEEMKKNVESLKTAIDYHDTLLNNLRSGRHPMVAASLEGIPFDPRNDNQLTSFVKDAIVSSSSTFIEPIEVIHSNEKRYLRLDKTVGEIIVTDDSVFVYGNGNIILRSADVSINSWELAQATNTLIEMDYEMIKLLGETTSAVIQYQQTTDKAVALLYGDGSGIRSALEDMFWMEKNLLAKCEEILNSLEVN